MARPEGNYSAVNGDNPLFAWLGEAVSLVQRAWGPESERLAEIRGPFGIHGIQYGADDEGEYAVIGFTLPDDIYAEVEGDTYAQLEGFRIYRADSDA